MLLRELLLNALTVRFEGQFVAGAQDGLIATFPPAHHRVGDVTIWDDGHEVTIFVGEITHLHVDATWGEPADGVGSSAPEERIVSEVVAWLSALFADKILLWCSPTVPGLGGHRRFPLGDDDEWLMSPDQDTFVWSGPVPNSHSGQ